MRRATVRFRHYDVAALVFRPKKASSFDLKSENPPDESGHSLRRKFVGNVATALVSKFTWPREPQKRNQNESLAHSNSNPKQTNRLTAKAELRQVTISAIHKQEVQNVILKLSTKLFKMISVKNCPAEIFPGNSSEIFRTSFFRIFLLLEFG